MQLSLINIKRTTIIFFTLFNANLLLSAQEAPEAFKQCLGDPEIATRSICLNTNYQKEVVDNIQWALNKYWKTSKALTVTELTPYNKKVSYLSVGDWQNKGEDGNFISSKMQALKPISASAANVFFEMPFDNIQKAKGEEIIGADKNAHIMACKALSYTMIFCYVTQSFNNPDMKKRKAFSNFIDSIDVNKEELKTTTVLVPKELLDNGITEEALKAMKSRYIIETSEQIANRIKEGTDVKNYSHFIVYKRNKCVSEAYILDLETGQLLAYSSINAGKVGRTFKLEDRHVIDLLNKIYAKSKN